MILVSKIQIPTLPTVKPRRLYVYLPHDYASSDRRYPVLYMFDGHNVFYNSHATFGKSWGMKEYLQKTKQPIIVVAVECNHEGNQRLSEYAPWDFHAPKPFNADVQGRGRITMDWLTQTLKPEIDATYRTLPDREHTLIAGSSMGGLMSIYAVTAYNDVFSRAAALSPSLWVDRARMAQLIKASPLAKPTQVYLDTGSAEAVRYNRDCAEQMFRAARLLTKAGACVEARVCPGAQHCEADWEKRIPVFMEYLLG